MKQSVIIASLLGFAVAGCASSKGELAKPQGEPLGPGMVGFTEARESARVDEGAVSPWEPNAFYPAMATFDPSNITAQDGRDERVESARQAQGPRPMATRSSTGATARLLFQFYSSTWSRADGSTCRFSPTCSGFGRQAIARHGVFGLVMTFGRLHRNHADADFYDVERGRLRDPVSLHSFWFSTPSEEALAEEPEIGAYLQVRQAARLNLPAPPENDDEASD